MLLAELRGWAAARSRPTETIRYGDAPDQVAELRLPDGPGPHRVAVVIHGGFWRAVWRRDLMDALAVDLADRGWASWNVEYRRIGCGGGVPETLDDVAAACGALVSVGAPLDRSQVAAIGHSAGGHLALWLAGTGRLASAVSLGGVADLEGAAAADLGGGAARELCGGGPDHRPEAYALADPLRRLPTRARTLLLHGDLDEDVPIEQARRYARAAQEAGDDCTLLELAGVGHFEPIDPRSTAWEHVLEWL